MPPSHSLPSLCSRFLRSLSGRLSAQGADLSDLDLLQISAVECRCSYRGTSLFILTGKDNQNINLRHPVLFQSPSLSQPLPQPQYVFSNCHSIVQKSLDDLVHKGVVHKAMVSPSNPINTITSSAPVNSMVEFSIYASPEYQRDLEDVLSNSLLDIVLA